MFPLLERALYHSDSEVSSRARDFLREFTLPKLVVAKRVAQLLELAFMAWDQTLLTDSGGFQVIRNRIQMFDEHKRLQIVSWLKRHCDYAMTFDIPTAALRQPKHMYTRTACQRI